MVLIAYRHETRSKVTHLRVKQSFFSTEMKDRLHRVGSPARWLPEHTSWDYPLTAAACIALHKIAVETRETIEWRDGLLEFAEAHIKQHDAEHQVRLAIERLIRDKPPLDAYVTRTQDDDGTPKLPIYHQQISFHWSQRVNGLLLAHDPGTGKTRSATDASGGWYRNGQIRPMEPMVAGEKAGVRGGVLVVCPKTVMKTWERELLYWQNASSVVIRGDAVRKARLSGTPAHYHIINYETLKYVTHNEYDGLILDECHRVANNSQQTENAHTIAQVTRKRLGLSGTPIANKLESIFNPMLIIDGGKALGASLTAFREKFFDKVTLHTKTKLGSVSFDKYNAKDGAEKAIAAALAESTYFVKKEEVLPNLPKKTHSPRFLEMTPEQERYYKQVKSEAITYIQDTSVTVEMAVQRMMKLLQICQGFVIGDTGTRHFTDAKTDALMELVTDTLSQRKVILWAYFTYEIDRIVEQLKGEGIPHVRVDGTVTSQRQRDLAMDRWNNDSDLRVYIRQLSMSEGVTLHASQAQIPCFDTIYMGLSYKYIDWVQSQDRIHRIGQDYPCNYIYLLTENGLDRHVYDACLDKYNTAERVHSLGKKFYLDLLRA